MKKRIQAQLITMAPELLNLTSAVPPYRGGGKTELRDKFIEASRASRADDPTGLFEFEFVAQRRVTLDLAVVSWWAYYFLRDACIAENEI